MAENPYESPGPTPRPQSLFSLGVSYCCFCVIPLWLILFGWIATSPEALKIAETAPARYWAIAAISTLSPGAALVMFGLALRWQSRGLVLAAIVALLPIVGFVIYRVFNPE
jgi:hypothetical protein